MSEDKPVELSRVTAAHAIVLANATKVVTKLELETKPTKAEIRELKKSLDEAIEIVETWKKHPKS